jgi:hypothetical protein
MVNQKKVKSINKNSVSLAGEFAVLSQLALRGYDANMTLGHTKGVDILVSDPDSGRMYQLEVKTKLSRHKPEKSKLFGLNYTWIMGAKHDSFIKENLFYCFVLIDQKTRLMKYFVVPCKVVAKYTNTQHQLWLKSNDQHKDNPMRQFRIGFKGNQYPIETPSAEKYEDNWAFNT